MITASVRFNGYLVRWIVDCCQCNRNTISEFIRDLLYEKMQQGHLEFNRIKPNQNQCTTKTTPVARLIGHKTAGAGSSIEKESRRKVMGKQINQKEFHRTATGQPTSTERRRQGAF